MFRSFFGGSTRPSQRSLLAEWWLPYAEGNDNRIPKRVETRSPAKGFMAASAQTIAIFAPLIIALPTTLGTIVIHGVAVIAVVHFIRHERRVGRAGIRFWGDVVIVSAAALFALMAHLVEIVIWALVFALCGEFTQTSHRLFTTPQLTIPRWAMVT